MGRFKKKYFYVSRNKKKPLARKYEINKTCYLLMLLYNFCKYYNYSFNSLAIFLREQNWTLTSLFFNIRYWLQTAFFSLWWNKGWRCIIISIFWSYYLRKHLLWNYFFSTYDKSSHNSDTIVLFLFLSHLDQCPFNHCNLD